jgi:hypothetical protein
LEASWLRPVADIEGRTRLRGERVSADFTLSAEDTDLHPPQLTLAAGTRRVALDSDVILAPSCTSTSVDWGDGTPLAIDDKGFVHSCSLPPGNIHVEHTYAAPGTYTVKLRTTEFDMGEPIANIAMYRKAVISVP